MTETNVDVLESIAKTFEQPQQNEEVIPFETNPDKRALAQLDWLVKENPSVANDENFKKTYVELQNKVSGKAVETAKVVPPQDAQSTQETEVDDNSPKSLLFGKGKPKKEQDFSTAPIPDTPEFKEFVKTTFGIDDPKKLMSSAMKWKNDSKRLPEIEEKLQEQEEFFTTLPEAIKVGIQKWSNNEEGWDKAMIETASNKINYNKSFEKQDTETLLNKYFPDHGYTSEEIKEGIESGDPVIAKLVNGTKQLFNNDKEIIKQRTDSAIEQEKRNKQVFAENLNKSIETFTEKYPDTDKVTLKKLETVLRKGDIYSLFYNKDGTPKPEAVKTLFYAINGEEELNLAIGKVNVKSANDATAEIVSRGADKPTITTGTKPNLTEADLMKKFGFLGETGSLYDRMFQRKAV